MSASLCRFYGWSPETIDSTPYKDLLTYYMCMEKVEAKERLMDLTIGDYPNAKDETRKRIHKNLSKAADTNINKETLTNEEFAKRTGIWQKKQP